MRTHKLLLAALLLVGACKAKDDYCTGPCPTSDAHVAVDAHVIDAHVDASVCGADVLVTCDVAITCSGIVSHFMDNACASATAPSFDDVSQKVIADAMTVVSCTAGATYAVTCMAPPNAWKCALGIEMEPDVTACVPKEPYDSPMIADVCTHLPSNSMACSVACDAAALHMFAMPGHVVTTYTCTSTDGILYIAAAR